MKSKWKYLWLLLALVLLAHLFLIPAVINQLLEQEKNQVQYYIETDSLPE